MKTLSTIAELAEGLSARIAGLLAILAALSVAAIVVVLVFSSVQRYALTRPVPATEEIAAYLFVCCAFLSMMDGLVQGRHIRLLPVWKRLPSNMQAWAMIAGHVGALAVIAFVFREAFDFAWQSREYGSRSYVANLIEWPWMMVIPFSLATLALAIAARMLGDLARMFRGEPMPEAARSDEEEAI